MFVAILPPGEDANFLLVNHRANNMLTKAKFVTDITQFQHWIIAITTVAQPIPVVDVID